MTKLSQQVLLLNATYEPLSVVNLKHAIGLMYLDKVDTVEADGVLLHSPSVTFEAPSIIRLKNYINIRCRRVKFNRRNIFRRDRNTCQYCGKVKGDGIELTVDHVIPVSRGGKPVWENVVACCTECNGKKGNRTPKQAKMPLLSKAKKPSLLTFIQNSYLLSAMGKPEWKKYLFLT